MSKFYFDRDNTSNRYELSKSADHFIPRADKDPGVSNFLLIKEDANHPNCARPKGRMGPKYTR